MQRENLKKGVFFGIIGNILFVAFGIICFVYYKTYRDSSVFSKILEATAYGVEFMGFGLLLYSDYLIAVSVRLRKMMKVIYTVYIVIEAVMMVLELNAGELSFYEPYSLPVAIVHAAVAGCCALAFLQLDPDNTKYEVAVVVCISIIFAGMLGNLLGIRVYFSIVLSAIGYTVLFGSIKYLMDREEMDVDCYGDRASEKSFSSSTLFADPDLQRLEPEEDVFIESVEDDEPKPETADGDKEEKKPEEKKPEGKKKQRRKKSNFI